MMPVPPFMDASAGPGGVQTYSSDPDYRSSSAAQAAALSPFLADPSQPAPYGPGQGYSSSPAGPAPLPYDPAPYAGAAGGMAQYQPSPGVVDLPPARSALSAANNPIPSISEDDLISLDGPSQPALAAAPQYQAQTYQPYQPAPAPAAPAPARVPMNQDAYINTYGGGYSNYPTPDQQYVVEPVQPQYQSQPYATAPYSQPQTAYAPPAPAPAPYAQPQPGYAQPQSYGAPLDQQPRIGSIQDAPLTDLVGMSTQSYTQTGSYAPQPVVQQPQTYAADPYADP